MLIDQKESFVNANFHSLQSHHWLLIFLARNIFHFIPIFSGFWWYLMISTIVMFFLIFRGILWLLMNYFFFNSKVKIEMNRITAINREKTAFVVPNAISIQTPNKRVSRKICFTFPETQCLEIFKKNYHDDDLGLYEMRLKRDWFILSNICMKNASPFWQRLFYQAM